MVTQVSSSWTLGTCDTAVVEHATGGLMCIMHPALPTEPLETAQCSPCGLSRFSSRPLDLAPDPIH